MFDDKSIGAIKESVDKGEPGAGPMDVQIIPTPRCNAACAFCPLHAIPEPLIGQTPRFNTYKEDLPGGLLDRLADDLYYLGGLRRVTITGGEPLLYSHIIPVVFQFSMSFPETELAVVTNGIKLKKFASFFVHAGLDNLTVSINAGSEQTYKRQNPMAAAGAFDQVLAGVAAVTDARKKSGKDKPRVNLSVVLTRNSIGDVEDLFEIGRRRRVDAVTFVPLMEIRLKGGAANTALKAEAGALARFTDEVSLFADKARDEGFFLGYADGDEDAGVITSGDLYKRQPCYTGYAFAAIYPNGDVRPCCHCEPIMGNLTRQSFAEIWRGEEYARFRERALEIQEGPELEGCLCGECGYCYENREIHKGVAGS